MESVILTCGDSAVSVRFGDEISISVSRRVTVAMRALEREPICGVTELQPTYCALTVYYDPLIIGYDELCAALRARLETISGSTGDASGNERGIVIPVLYGGEAGIDLPEVAAYHGMTEREIIDTHTAHESYIYMIGFTPGMGYLGSDNGLTIPRRTSPRVKVEEGSVLIWANQSLVLPVTSPTGWHIIGKTPLKIFDASKSNPFLLSAGMRVRFREINSAVFGEIKASVDSGKYIPELYESEAR